MLVTSHESLITVSKKQCCGSKYIEFGSGFRIKFLKNNFKEKQFFFQNIFCLTIQLYKRKILVFEELFSQLSLQSGSRKLLNTDQILIRIHTTTLVGKKSNPECKIVFLLHLYILNIFCEHFTVLLAKKRKHPKSSGRAPGPGKKAWLF